VSANPERLINGHVLIVDDNQVNRKLLSRILEEQRHTYRTAENGLRALESLATEQFDVVLLDIMMPEMDGYETLTRIKQDEQLRHIPVIIISAVDEIDSVVRCIKIGAVDYLAKPFNATLLRARLDASLADKRLRDLEIEYLEQVNLVMQAAASVEDETFELSVLDSVSGRDDALGQLARVFNRMASEVKLREERLKRQVQDLRIEIDEARQEKNVAEITDTAYFKTLRGQADDLRDIISGANDEEGAVPGKPG
jgi:CheY-like chemotaxis protein